MSDAPVAISFSFPGSADFPQGIIGDIGNLPSFRGRIAIGPMLEGKFGIPVFFHNDGDLFKYGEAIAGFLPHVNSLLESAGSPRRYRNLFGMTLDTGLGGGIVRNGELFVGDTCGTGEIWLMRHKLRPDMNSGVGAYIRAVRRGYAKLAETPFNAAPDPKTIFEIGNGNAAGNQFAAIESFRQLGEVAGDALANALCLIDGLAVIGGGVSGVWPLFLPTVVAELNGSSTDPNGTGSKRLSQTAFNLEDPDQLAAFLKGDQREITVPGSDRTLMYDPMPRIGVGMTRLGTSESVAIGAYAYVLKQLNR